MNDTDDDGGLRHQLSPRLHSVHRQRSKPTEIKYIALPKHIELFRQMEQTNDMVDGKESGLHLGAFIFPSEISGEIGKEKI